MVDHRTLQLMLRNPQKLMEFHATGKVPRVAEPSSPLITLLQSIYPAERRLVTAVKVCPQLGYMSHNVFQNASQALNWLKPSYAAESYPSESHRDRRFTRPLTIDDLAKFANVPDLVKEEWWRRNPRARRAPEDPSPGF